MSTHLPVHPIFGTAIGLRRNGQPIWPIRGGSTDVVPPVVPLADPAAPPVAPPSPPDEALGDGGKKALDAERATNKALSKDKAGLEKERDALAAQLKAIEDANKTDAEKQSERIASLEKEAAKALRYEAAEKTGLSLALAQRLKGGTLDEMIADAEELKTLIGGNTAQTSTTETKTSSTPKPDRRQGGGGGEVTGTMAAGRAAYEARKNRN